MSVNENLDKALAEIIDKAVSGVDSTVELLSGQIPDVVSQVLVFELAWCSLISVLSALCIACFVKLSVAGAKEKFEDYELNFGAMGFGALFSALSFWVFMEHIYDVLKIWLAPKIYLLEYAADLMK